MIARSRRLTVPRVGREVDVVDCSRNASDRSIDVRITDIFADLLVSGSLNPTVVRLPKCQSPLRVFLWWLQYLAFGVLPCPDIEDCTICKPPRYYDV